MEKWEGEQDGGRRVVKRTDDNSGGATVLPKVRKASFHFSDTTHFVLQSCDLRGPEFWAEYCSTFSFHPSLRCNSLASLYLFSNITSPFTFHSLLRIYILTINSYLATQCIISKSKVKKALRFMSTFYTTSQTAASDQYIHEAYRIVANGVGTLFHDASFRE